MPTLLLAALLASRPIPVATACDAEGEVCREGCTLEFGTTQRTRAALARCLETCQATHARCTERWNDVHANDLAEGALDDRPEAPRSPEAEPARAPVPAPAVEPEPTAEPLPEDDEIKLPTDEQIQNVPWEKRRRPNDAGSPARPKAPTRRPPESPR